MKHMLIVFAILMIACQATEWRYSRKVLLSVRENPKEIEGVSSGPADPIMVKYFRNLPAVLNFHAVFKHEEGQNREGPLAGTWEKRELRIVLLDCSGHQYSQQFINDVQIINLLDSNKQGQYYPRGLPFQDVTYIDLANHNDKYPYYLHSDNFMGKYELSVQLTEEGMKVLKQFTKDTSQSTIDPILASRYFSTDEVTVNNIVGGQNSDPVTTVLNYQDNKFSANVYDFENQQQHINFETVMNKAYSDEADNGKWWVGPSWDTEHILKLQEELAGKQTDIEYVDMKATSGPNVEILFIDNETLHDWYDMVRRSFEDRLKILHTQTNGQLRRMRFKSMSRFQNKVKNSRQQVFEAFNLNKF